MKKHVLLLTALLSLPACCLTAAADAPRGFIGDTGASWDTSSCAQAWCSSNLLGRYPSNTIDGSGISANGWTHNGGVFPPSWGGNGGMWMSNSTPAAYPYIRANTQWIRFDFDQVYNLDQMWIWNWNDNNYPQQGMKQIRIIASTTDTEAGYIAGDANPVFDGIMPMANATDADPVNLTVNFGGLAARYILIYVPAEAGLDYNWSNGTYGEVGLSEVRFYPVPEPATMLVLGLGTLLACKRRGH